MKTYLKLDFEILPGEKRFTDATEHEVRDGAAMFARVADEYKGLTKPSGTAPGESGIAVADDLSRGSIWLPVPDDMYVCFTWKGEVRSVSAVRNAANRIQHYTADIHAASQRVVRHHVSSTPPIVIDARMKPWFPKEVEVDPATAATVSQRWKQYFPHRRVEMGDSSRGHLDPPASQ